MNYRLFLFLFFCQCCFAQEFYTLPKHYARERTYDVLHYTLNIDIDEKDKSCEGTVGIKLVPLRPHLDVVKFDAAEMNINRVMLNHKSLAFAIVGETLTVVLERSPRMDDTLEFVITYKVTSPRKGLYFVRPDSGYPKKQWQVWSQGEPEENHFWFPCYDFPNDKATSEMIVSVNEHWTAISNGKLLEVKRDPAHHRAIYHWLEHHPHSSYLISLVAGEYIDVSDKWKSVPINNFVYKHQRDIAMQSFAKTPEVMEFYSSHIGFDYPWEKYVQTVVQDFIYGGEENTSATTLTDVTIHDARAHQDYSSDGLVAHELAHQWWGDLLTCRDWSHSWLNEGFASYFDVLFQEHDQGRDVAMKSILDAQNSITVSDIREKRRPTVCAYYINPNDLFDNHIYGKGACVLHMLRSVLGDDLFWKSMNHYAHKFAFQNVETNDFKIAIEEATGYNLQWFFKEWLYDAGYPELKVHTAWSQDDRVIRVSVQQIQKVDSLTGLFRMPADIEVWVNNVPETYRVTISKDTEEFSFPAYQQPELVIFDKGNTLLKRIRFEKPLDEWVFQLMHATEGIDRYLAAEELHWIADSNRVKVALSKALIEDPFWEVRREAAYAFGDSKHGEFADTLIPAYGDRDARVRTAVVTVLRNFKGEKVLKLLQHAFEKDSSYAVAAAALYSLTVVDSVNAKQYCLAGLRRDSYREGVRSAAIRALASVGDDSAVATIKEYTKYGVDRTLRIECLSALSRMQKKEDRLVNFFIDFLRDPSFHVRQAVISILGTVGDARAIEPLQHCVETEADTRLVKSARESIVKIQQRQQLSH